MHWRRNWQPTPVFLPGESQGQWSWWAAVCGVAQKQQQQQQQQPFEIGVVSSPSLLMRKVKFSWVQPASKWQNESAKSGRSSLFKFLAALVLPFCYILIRTVYPPVHLFTLLLSFCFLSVTPFCCS